MKIRRLGCSRAASLEGHATAKSGVYAPLVVIGGESIQFTMELEAVPEEGVIEILALKGSDKALDEGVRAKEYHSIMPQCVTTATLIAY